MVFIEPISEIIWDMKYRYKRDGEVIDQSIEDTWRRVANSVAQSEVSKEQAEWAGKFYGILENFRYLPGGRILAGAGTTHHVTLFNCFVMDIAEDSLSEIFEALREGALTLQQGGGVGYDFSVLRPHGDMAKKTGIPSSGPVSFMRIWDTTCAVLLSTGARRGAMMAVMRCDHPDIFEFIEAKSDARELRHFNVSVMVSDEFMQAVKNDDKWALIFPDDANASGEIIYKQWNNSSQKIPCRVYRYVKARELWHKIIKSAYEYAEPGVLFGDTINRMNNLWYREYIQATNPCGEIPLPPYGACNLGAINLTQFVLAPFSKDAKINWRELENTVNLATRFQDNIIDISHYPLSVQREQATGTRRIGLGMTGLADAMIMLGIRYGTKESTIFAANVMKKIADITWATSIELAKEKGTFPFYTEEYLLGAFVQALDEDLQKLIRMHGVRNSHHNTIAPTGTISLLANNVSNGIEPVFKAEYQRHVRTENEMQTHNVKDYAYHIWQNKELPPAWIDTDMLTPDAHLDVQGAVQAYIDNAISKTINLPHDFPFASLEHVYTKAHSLGLKGCTIFRPNPVTGSVLEIKECDITEVGNCCPE